MLCVLCLNHPQAPGMEIPAVVVVNGLSSCLDHMQICIGSKSYHEARTRLLHKMTMEASKLMAEPSKPMGRPKLTKVPEGKAS